jgi:hypothetical protein
MDPESREMDLNPVIVREEDLTVVDARMILDGFDHRRRPHAHPPA